MSNSDFPISPELCFCIHLFLIRGSWQHTAMFHSQKTIIHVNTPSLSVLSNAKWIPSGNATLTKPNIYRTEKENQFTWDREKQRERGRGGGSICVRGKVWRRKRETALKKKNTMKKTNDRQSEVWKWEKSVIEYGRWGASGRMQDAEREWQDRERSSLMASG